jgi:hypothetical protein
MKKRCFFLRSSLFSFNVVPLEEGESMRALLGVVIVLAGLSACSAAKQEPAGADLQWAETSRPADAHWKPRLGQGVDQLVRHASDGFNAMPAMGQCNDCSADDLRALTLFMARSGT